MDEKRMESRYILILKNIQSIKYAKVEIGGISVLVGDNNLGKSTINKVLFALVNASEKLRGNQDNESIKNFIKLYVNEEEKIKRIEKKLEGREIELEDDEKEVFENLKGLISLQDSVKRSTTFSSELVLEIPHPIIREGCKEGMIELYDSLENKIVYKAQLKALIEEYLLNEKLKNELIEEGYTVVNNSFAISEEINELNLLKYKKVVYIDASDLLVLTPVWGEMLREVNIRESIKQSINMIMKFNDVLEKIDTLVYSNGVLVYKTIDENGKNKFINIDSVGDGYKRIALLNSTIKYIKKYLVNKNLETLFLIEEPEIGVHPKRIKEIAKIIKDASEYMDIVFTTHDSLLVNILMSYMKVFKATTDTDEVVNKGTDIKFVNEPVEILTQYLEPLIEARKKEFENIMDS